MSLPPSLKYCCIGVVVGSWDVAVICLYCEVIYIIQQFYEGVKVCWIALVVVDSEQCDMSVSVEGHISIAIHYYPVFRTNGVIDIALLIHHYCRCLASREV